jgi:SOS-response transcriptional repressor LexA
MAPTIPNGSHVILSEVNDFRWLDYGEIYALVASNGLRTIKRIRKNEDESKLTLVPDNPDYDINEIDKADVLRLFRVVGTIQFATP